MGLYSMNSRVFPLFLQTAVHISCPGTKNQGRIRIRWRLDLIPRFSGSSFKDVFSWLDSNGDGTPEIRNPKHETRNSEPETLEIAP